MRSQTKKEYIVHDPICLKFWRMQTNQEWQKANQWFPANKSREEDILQYNIKKFGGMMEIL